MGISSDNNLINSSPDVYDTNWIIKFEQKDTVSLVEKAHKDRLNKVLSSIKNASTNGKILCIFKKEITPTAVVHALRRRDFRVKIEEDLVVVMW